jgi:hypothetical protein
MAATVAGLVEEGSAAAGQAGEKAGTVSVRRRRGLAQEESHEAVGQPEQADPRRG